VKIVAALLFSASLAASAETWTWAPTLDAAATWNSNATNSDRAGDEIGALQLRAEAAFLARQFTVGQDHALTVEFAANAESWPRFSGLDRWGVGPRVTWEHRFGLGALAPVLRIELEADFTGAHEAPRNGTGGLGRISWRRRFNETTQFAAAYERARFDARSAVFDRTAGEGSVQLIHDVGETWTLSGGARWREGTVLSYATPPRPDLVSVARVRTGVTTFHESRVAYSIIAHSVAGFVTATRTLGERADVSLGYEYRTTSREPLDYVNHLVSVALRRQF
jgi:hypothetical protein